MEGSPPGYDDWFDDPEPPTQEAARGREASRADDGDEDGWVLPGDGPRRPRRSGSGDGTITVGSLRLTTTQAAIIAAAILAVFFAILAATGVFSSSNKATVPPITGTTTLPTTSKNTTTFQTATAPTHQLKPGDTGHQVKLLQQTLNTLGFPVGKPDGDYGPNTQSAVEQFQSSKHLTPDGVVGPKTLSALQRALSG